jgi:hypothetical protein
MAEKYELLRQVFGEAVDEGEKLYKQYGAPLVNRVLSALGSNVDPKVATRAVQRQAKVEGIKPKTEKPHPRVPEGVSKLSALPGKGGKSRRIDTPANLTEQASKRARAEARTRLEKEPDAAARRAARATYTDPPLQIDADPELARFAFRPGNVQSVTEQAAEFGVPVTGRTPFFTQHPSGYSTSYGGNAPDPTNFTAEYRDRLPDLSAKKLNAEDFKVGSGLIGLLGDATGAGRDVVSVMGTKLVRPVATLGGGRYGLGERGAGSRGVWSSNANVVEGQAKHIRDWQNQNPGEDVLGMHVNMGSTGSDFSHQTAAVLANLIPNMDLSGSQRRAIDDYIRAGETGLPDFYGFAEDPELGFFDVLMRPGSERKLITKRLSNVTKEAQAAGVPADLGALARLAVAAPELRLAPQGASGFGVVKFDPNNFLRIDPALLSGTKRRLFEDTNEYGGVLGGLPDLLRPDYNGVLTGEFLGQTERLIPAEIPFRSIFDRAKTTTSKGKPTSTTMKFKSFATDTSPVVTVTPEIQDMIGKYLYDSSRFAELGYAEGGFAVRNKAHG